MRPCGTWTTPQGGVPSRENRTGARADLRHRGRPAHSDPPWYGRDRAGDRGRFRRVGPARDARPGLRRRPFRPRSHQRPLVRRPSGQGKHLLPPLLHPARGLPRCLHRLGPGSTDESRYAEGACSATGGVPTPEPVRRAATGPHLRSGSSRKRAAHGLSSLRFALGSQVRFPAAAASVTAAARKARAGVRTPCSPRAPR